MMFAWVVWAILQQAPAKDFVGPPAPVEDADAIRKRLQQSMQQADKSLQANDVGQSTRALQKSIVEDIAALLRLMQDRPPPPNQTGTPPPEQPPGDTPDNDNNQRSAPSSGGSGRPSDRSAPSKNRSQPEAGKRERRGASGQPSEANRNGTPNPAGKDGPEARREPDQATGMRPGDAPGNPGANPDQAKGATMPQQDSGKPEKMADVYRDVWGHLPESLRQEVDHYYRERFMPKYRELLRQYYTRLAEADKRPEEKK